MLYTCLSTCWKRTWQLLLLIPPLGFPVPQGTAPACTDFPSQQFGSLVDVTSLHSGYLHLLNLLIRLPLSSFLVSTSGQATITLHVITWQLPEQPSCLQSCHLSKDSFSTSYQGIRALYHLMVFWLPNSKPVRMTLFTSPLPYSMFQFCGSLKLPNSLFPPCDCTCWPSKAHNVLTCTMRNNFYSPFHTCYVTSSRKCHWTLFPSVELGSWCVLILYSCLS